MIAFQFSLNGKHITTAGQDDLDVLTASITAVGILGDKSTGTMTVKEDCQVGINITGLASYENPDKNKYLCWTEPTPLDIGDQICITLCEVDTADKPVDMRERLNQEMNKNAEVDEGEADLETWESARDFYFKHKDQFE